MVKYKNKRIIHNSLAKPSRRKSCMCADGDEFNHRSISAFSSRKPSFDPPPSVRTRCQPHNSLAIFFYGATKQLLLHISKFLAPIESNMTWHMKFMVLILMAFRILRTKKALRASLHFAISQGFFWWNCTIHAFFFSFN
jgi:hypothetical protein